MMLRVHTVDSFSASPFSGNPAAVCVLAAFPSEEWMQQLATEMNLSETAFVVPAGDEFGLRWFTPAAEVDLCGHATLAAAHVLWQEGVVASGREIKFETRSGQLGARTDGSWITLDFPTERVARIELPDGLAGALGVAPSGVFRNRMDLLVQFESERVVRALTPNLELLSAHEVRGVIVTASSSEKPYDYVSRFFAPRFGVPEDPVTGSAHCALGPFWSDRLGSESLVGYQASPRGGTVRTTVKDDRVLLSGQAVSVYSADLSAAAQP